MRVLNVPFLKPIEESLAAHAFRHLWRLRGADWGHDLLQSGNAEQIATGIDRAGGELRKVSYNGRNGRAKQKNICPTIIDFLDRLRCKNK